jgi:hypothetical protein
MQGIRWESRARAAARGAVIAGLFLALAAGSRPAAGALSPDEKRLLAPLKGARMMPMVERLCRPEFEGRKAGTPGAARAVAILSDHFRSLGLEPLPDAPGYRQAFTMSYSLLRSRWDRKAEVTTGAGRTVQVVYADFPSRECRVRGEAIFVGYGILRPDRGWDDYQDVSLGGKIAVFWGDNPPGVSQTLDARCRAARARGAVGCLVVSPRTRDENGEPVDRGVGRFLSDFPVIQLGRQTAAGVFGRPVPRPAPLIASGRTPRPGAAPARAGRAASAAQFAASESAKQWTPLPEAPPTTRLPARPNTKRQLLANVSFHIPASVDPARPLDNVLGVIPGSDPVLKDEWVIFSAHLDHMGQQGRAFFPGADDNASGVAVVCAVAETFRRMGARPRRSVLFALWNGEECGLLGSRHFVHRPLVPLERTVGMLQLDMVGAGQSDAFLTSARRGPALFFRHFEAAARELSLSLPADTVKGVSDHVPFLRSGVPAMVATTAGVHPHYHTVGDRPSGVRPAALENCARLSALALWRLANDGAETTAHKRSPSRLAQR